MSLMALEKNGGLNLYSEEQLSYMHEAVPVMLVRNGRINRQILKNIKNGKKIMATTAGRKIMKVLQEAWKFCRKHKNYGFEIGRPTWSKIRKLY